MSPTTRHILRWLRSAAVFLFVVWHLFFLVATNAKLRSDWLDTTVGRYESYLGLDQRWGMFSSPLWRRAPFPAARIEMDDGSLVEVSSPNQPDDMTHFVRFTGWRQRKLEHHLVTGELQGTYQEPMLRRLMESYVARWRSDNPDDPRKPVKVTMLRRDFKMPAPGEAWQPQPEPIVYELITFPLTDE